MAKLIYVASDARIQLELLEKRRFTNGVVNLRYRIQS